MSNRELGSSGVWAFIQREPLALLVVLGVVLYALWALAAPAGQETVRIEEAALRGLETRQVELLGRELTDEERQDLREGFIDDEVLLREALRRGLQFSDGRVRQRLTRIMRGALTETIADPSVAQLQAYFRDNIDRFTTPESASLEQVLYPWGEEHSEEQIRRDLDDLLAGADSERYGADSMLVGRLQPRRTRMELVRTFGADFADRVEQMAVGTWTGPLESIQGIHLVRVTERHPPEVATFEKIESYLRQDWLMTRTRELQQDGIDEIRAGYRIELVEE